MSTHGNKVWSSEDAAIRRALLDGVENGRGIELDVGDRRLGGAGEAVNWWRSCGTAGGRSGVEVLGCIIQGAVFDRLAREGKGGREKVNFLREVVFIGRRYHLFRISVPTEVLCRSAHGSNRYNGLLDTHSEACGRENDDLNRLSGLLGRLSGPQNRSSQVLDRKKHPYGYHADCDAYVILIIHDLLHFSETRDISYLC